MPDLAALLFAVHPVNVESVAWIEHENTLSLVLFLLSVLSFCATIRKMNLEIPSRPWAPGVGTG